ncbi:iron ABC transporter permease [Svornostia abyssi]|uniref:Iron ABC transporter permease n=1 Tax=Svornostia abyssi TaxID=2898438 RepID=A0ABY5PHG3_9ACTN|nr:iron ABC transporter permease [Parviterribacteraceae bacterium J379]
MTRRAAPPALLAAAGIVAAGAVLPVAYLAWVVLGDLPQWWETVWSARALELLLRSVGLAVAVTAATVAISLPISWLTVRTDLPGRGVWSVLCALPLVIPSYIGAYLLVSALGPRGELQGVLEGPLGIDRLPSLYGFWGAWLALTLFCFPYVLLPLQAVLRRMDPSLEEAARGMGCSGWAAYRGVVLPQLLPAVGAGALLVSLYVLSDFGAVSIMRFDSFTRVIYTQYRSSFDRVGAASLATLLVLVTLVILWLEARSRRSGALHRSAPGTARPPRPIALGRWRWPALAFCAGVVGLALALPVGMLALWTTRSISGTVEWGAVFTAAGHSLLAAGLAAGVAVLCALPVALLAARYRGRWPRLIEGGAYLGHALPGIVVALALVFFATRAVVGLYQTLAMLVVALVILFLPQAIGAVRTAVLQVDPRLEEAARSLGRSPTRAFVSVTAPLLRGGVAAGAALVFLTAVKELPATLILAPIGFDTLAIDVWRTTSVGFYERGAVPSLLLLAVSAVPMAILVLRERSDA